jgi:acetyl-CoA carboxylase carboxyl transferase subunit beta
MCWFIRDNDEHEEPVFELVDIGLRSTDPLNFTDIKPDKKRLRAAQEVTGLDDAILNAVGRLGHHPVVVSAMEYDFIGGSMGALVGEAIALIGFAGPCVIEQTIR